MSNEQIIINSLAEAKKEYLRAKERLAKTNRAYIEAETLLIEKKIKYENLIEELRTILYHNQTDVDDLREKDIDDFRKRFPELCAKKD